MNLKIRKVTDANSLDGERVAFAVNEDDFLGAYVVFKTKKVGEEQFSNKTEHTYWFPDREVKKGDLVVLYTKAGTNIERKNTDGTTTYFFYWYLDSPIWATTDDAIVLARLQDWEFQHVNDNKD
jgi:hypothetical protein